MKKWFIGPCGLRSGWRAAAVLACGGCAWYFARTGFILLINFLFGVWGVTAENLPRAHGWIYLIGAHLSEWMIIAGGTALWIVAWLLTRLTGGTLDKGQYAGRSIAAGALFGCLLWALLRLTDSVRMGWHFSSPEWNGEILISLAAYFLTACSTEALFRGALHETTRTWPRWAAMTLSAVSFAVFSVSERSVGMVLNLLLIGLLMEYFRQKTHGYLPGAMMRFGAYGVVYGIFGCCGSASCALYESYPAAHDFLSGGNVGPFSGGLLCILLALLGAGFLLGNHKRTTKQKEQ